MSKNVMVFYLKNIDIMF